MDQRFDVIFANLDRTRENLNRIREHVDVLGNEDGETALEYARQLIEVFEQSVFTQEEMLINWRASATRETQLREELASLRGE